MGWTSRTSVSKPWTGALWPRGTSQPLGHGVEKWWPDFSGGSQVIGFPGKAHRSSYSPWTTGMCGSVGQELFAMSAEQDHTPPKMDG